MMSAKGRPGPIGGSWFGSPTRISRLSGPESRARSSVPKRSVGIIEHSSTMTVVAWKGLSSLSVLSAKMSAMNQPCFSRNWWIVIALCSVFVERRTRAFPVGASNSARWRPSARTSSWRKTLRTDVLPVPAPPVKTLSLREKSVVSADTFSFSAARLRSDSGSPKSPLSGASQSIGGSAAGFTFVALRLIIEAERCSSDWRFLSATSCGSDSKAVHRTCR